MQQSFTPSSNNRVSYNFTAQTHFPKAINKPFPTQNPPIKTYHPPDHLVNSIRQLETNNQIVDSPNRKKTLPGEGSPTLSPSISQLSSTEYKSKSYISMSGEIRGDNSPNEEFLRGSCSNILRKFESSTNLGCSLRNTTHFNPKNKLLFGSKQLKKSSETQNVFKNINSGKNSLQETPFLRPPERTRNGLDPLSKTPTKLFGSKKLDLNATYTSKTPVKYSLFQGSNKASGISKGSTESGDKKTFKSLNEIVESKAKQKMLQQTSISQKKTSKIINGFEVGQVLGVGKFGEVFLARNHTAGFVVALKKIVKARVVEHKMVDQFANQIRLHSCLEHPNIVRFYGCFYDAEDIYLVIEYMNGGTLFDYLNEVSCLSLRQTVEYLRDIIEALTYMHEKSIAHRDIKPENIVISTEGVAKLCDFGWSALVQTSRKTYCGTFDYAPPEILERKNYDTSVDVWCIGILTYELLTGRAPFQGDHRNVVMEKILNVDKQKINYTVDIAPEAKEFIEALVQKDPNLRPKAHDLLKFKLFSLFPSRPGKQGQAKK